MYANLSKVFKAILFLILPIMFYLLVVPEQMPPAPELRLVSGREQSEVCDGAARCIVAYLAPWCPACNSELAAIARVRSMVAETDGRVGLRVLIGSGRRSEIERMARKIGGEVISDEDGAIFEKLGGQYFPSWWIFDEKGNEVARPDLPGRLQRLISGDNAIRRSLGLDEFNKNN